MKLESNLWIFKVKRDIFITETVFQNTDLAFYVLLLSGFILLISSVWQLFQGKKTIALIQLSILVIPILFLGFMVYLFAGMINKPDNRLTIETIAPLIKEKTNLIIPKDFKVLDNLIEHTEGAFDSDYSLFLTIEYKESDEKNIREQILKNIEVASDKGLWKNYSNGFDFEHNNNEINQVEPFYFKVDTLKNKIELNLSHL